MRSSFAVVLTVVLVCAWGVARTAHAVDVDIVWSSSGTPDITASPGDTIYLLMNVTLTPGETVTALGASIRFDEDLADELNLLFATEYSLSPLSPLSAGVNATQESTAGIRGHVFTCENAALSVVFTTPGTSLLCLIGFEVTGNAVTDGVDVTIGFFGPQDGALDDMNIAFTPTFGTGASVNAPEPSRLLLGGVGLGVVLALSHWRRRRRG
jgi:hypothetical protein